MEWYLLYQSGWVYVSEYRIWNINVPFHSNFEEVNLRFYVRYREGDDWKRGVVFIKEIVPRSLLTFVANTLYNENYETMPMRHSWISDSERLTVEYNWKNREWNSFRVIADNVSVPIASNSEAEFITEHYWGYTKISNIATGEYAVEHQKWDLYPLIEYEIDVDFEDVYGREFSFLSNEKPISVFLTESSEILVKSGKRI